MVTVLISLCAGGVASCLVYPKFLESGLKTAECRTRKADLDQLQVRLNQGSKVEQDKRLLESQISALRSSVPKSAELDLMLIDVEKMCAACHVDLVAVETPSAEILRELQTAADEQAKANTVKPAAVGPANKQPKTPVKPASVVEEAALKSVVKQVYVTGDYTGLVAFMKMLESYQRIVGVSQIAVAIKSDDNDQRNAASEKADKLKLKQPLMAFLLTLYYLP